MEYYLLIFGILFIGLALFRKRLFRNFSASGEDNNTNESEKEVTRNFVKAFVFFVWMNGIGWLMLGISRIASSYTTFSEIGFRLGQLFLGVALFTVIAVIGIGVSSRQKQ